MFVVAIATPHKQVWAPELQCSAQDKLHLSIVFYQTLRLQKLSLEMIILINSLDPSGKYHSHTPRSLPLSLTLPVLSSTAETFKSPPYNRARTLLYAICTSQTQPFQPIHFTSNMKQALIILVLFLTLLPGCAILGWWLSKKWLQGRLDEYDRAVLAADVLNAQGLAGGGNGAARV